MVNTEQDSFIYSQVIMMTLAATLQRNKVYSSNTSEDSRKRVRKGIEQELTLIKDRYTQPVSEEDHEKNIVCLSNTISSKYKKYLSEERFRIGTAQKALNLFLKYLWCLGKAWEPPHFPIDAIMLEKIPGGKSVRWTKLDSINEYKAIIKKAKTVTDGKSLANWELYEYNS